MASRTKLLTGPPSASCSLSFLSAIRPPSQKNPKGFLTFQRWEAPSCEHRKRIKEFQMTSSPTALVPWMPPEGRDRQALASTTEGPMQKSCASPMRWSVRNKWLRSEEHTSELHSLMRISYAVFCL